jgi:hypothetical protein
VRGLRVRVLGERVDHMLWRPDLGIPAPEVDERLPLERGVPGYLCEKRSEVLLWKPIQPGRSRHDQSGQSDQLG